MSYKIFIDGREGTTGLKIHEYFRKRPDIEVLDIAEEKRKDLDERLAMVKKSDIAFLCLPDAASRELAEHADKASRILDTSTAHRVNPDWVYGLPELTKGQREKIKQSNRIAVPGCHATGFILLARPLVEAGIAGPDFPFSCHSVTGYSGGGKKMIADYEADQRIYRSGKRSGSDDALFSPRQYGLLQEHKHLPEMKAMTGVVKEPIFNPIVADYYSGMLVSVPVHRGSLKGQATLDEISQLYADYYRGQPMIQVMQEGEENGFLCANALSGKNNLQIFIYGNDERIMLAARYDNLGKGASGAAVQCMNLMLGLPEETGLL